MKLSSELSFDPPQNVFPKIAFLLTFGLFETVIFWHCILKQTLKGAKLLVINKINEIFNEIINISTN